MGGLFDSHVHFDELLAGTDLESVLEQSREVQMMIAVGGSPRANRQAADLARACHGRINGAVGYGRDRAGRNDSISELKSIMESPGIVAVGETGLDLHYEARTKDLQLSLFQQMLEAARAQRMPVIVHSREAEDLTIEFLAEHAMLWKGDSERLGVVHCFTGTASFARRLLDLGFFIGFSGIITFKNANDLRKIAGQVPTDRILIETDSPYLAPEPHRGGRNTPAFVRHVAEALARIRNCAYEEIVQITTGNAERLFQVGSNTERKKSSSF